MVLFAGANQAADFRAGSQLNRSWRLNFYQTLAVISHRRIHAGIQVFITA